MASENTLLTNNVIAKMMLMEFKNNLVIAKTARRQYEPVFDNTTGRTIRIRKPTRYLSADGAALVTQAIEQRTTDLVIDQRKHVGVALTTEQLTLELDDFQAQVVRPAMQRLANDVDQALYAAAVGSMFNAVGTAGTAPNTMQTILNAAAKLDQFGIPTGDRYCIMSPSDGAALKGALYNTFNEQFNKDIILRGSMGELGGFDFYTAQNVIRPTVTTGGTPLVKGAGQSGSTLITDGWTASIVIKKGTIFTIAGVDSVNPISQTDNNQLAQFVVTADTTVDGSGNATLPIETMEGGIVLAGSPYQNVTITPPDNAALTVNLTHTKNLAYHSEAFTLAMINLYAPKQGAWSTNLVDKDAGIALRMVRQYDINTDEDKIRVDALFGVRCFGQYGSVIMGS